MKKNIYTGIFCTILGLCTNTTANASIVSSGFLDEKLTEMTNATALQLDLKANQSDFTDLNTQISDSVDVLRLLFEEGFYGYELVNGTVNPEKFPNTISGAFNLLQQYLEAVAGSTMYGWTDSKGTSYAGLVDLNNGWTDSESNTYLGVKGLNDKIGTLPTKTAMSSCSVWRAIDLPQNEMPETIGGILEQLYSAGHVDSSCIHDGYNGPSLPNIIRRLIFGYNYDGGTAMMGINGLNVGSIDSTGNVIEPGLRQITNGWTDAKGGILINPGLKRMYDGWTDAKGGIINPGLKGMYEGWTDSGYNFPGLYELASDTFKFKNIFPNVSIGMLLSAGLEKYTTDIYTGPIYPLWKLSEGIDKIGTLPSGSLLGNSPAMDALFKFTQNTDTPVFPNSLSDLINQLYGSKGGKPSAISALLHGFEFTFPEYEGTVGIVPAMRLGLSATQAAETAQETATAAKSTADANTAKIGTLPSGEFPIFPGFDRLFPGLNQPLTYPTSLAELITAIYGNSETSARGLLAAIITGFPYFDKDGDGSPDKPIGLIPNYQSAIRANDLADANTAKIGTVPDGKNLAGMISETDAKIGTLPTEYATVGAALTAIKGIAEDAKAAALAAIPDPKTEGSTGKFVLTVDIVGDNATYRWEPIDRGDTTTTTE